MESLGLSRLQPLTYNLPQAPQMHQPSPVTLTGPSRPSLTMPSSFEFTRRKRWADLLIMELPEALLLVLSPACKVWYCGNSVTDLLGWTDHDLVDCDFIELMNGKLFSNDSVFTFKYR